MWRQICIPYTVIYPDSVVGTRRERRRRSCLFSFPNSLEVDNGPGDVDPLNGAEVGVIEMSLQIGMISP